MRVAGRVEAHNEAADDGEDDRGPCGPSRLRASRLPGASVGGRDAEPAHGPQRCTDLRDALPGIATDLLTARLHTLEEAGYVQRRTLLRPAAVAVYELTASGRRLGYMVVELARLGI